MKWLPKKSVVLFVITLFSGYTLADQLTSYTYNSIGQILTENGARTDVSDLTTYTYDTAGNRATLTNALIRCCFTTVTMLLDICCPLLMPIT